MIDFWGVFAVVMAILFAVALLYNLWVLYRRYLAPQPAAWPQPAARPQPEPEPEPEEDFEPEPEDEPELEESKSAPERRIFALYNGKNTFQMSESEYQAFLTWRRAYYARIEQQQAELEQARAVARAEAQARAEAEAAELARYPAWLVDFAARHNYTQPEQVRLLQDWIILIFDYAQTEHGGTMPVKPIWKEVTAKHRAAAPADCFTSYLFFSRLNEVLKTQGILTSGGRGVPARLIPDNLPQWIN